MKARPSVSGKYGRCLGACLLLGLSGTGSVAWTQSLDTMTWTSVAECTSVRLVEYYIRSHPDGKHVGEARDCLEGLANRTPNFEFNDGCDGCPELVLIPAGTYTMGSKRGEAPRKQQRHEEPRHEVTIGVPIAVGLYEVTRSEFEHFVRAERHETEDVCYSLNHKTGAWRPPREGYSWENPGFEQADRHPVVCVGWEDAQAYVDWLSARTGENYRLLSESEWEYAARAGTGTPRYWGRSTASQCKHENGLDKAFSKRYPGNRYPKMRWTTSACNDGHVHTAPVGSFDNPNGFGLHDMLGNAREWVDDCWHNSYTDAPVDGSAWTYGGNCGNKVLRGGSWANQSKNMRSATRQAWSAETRSDVLGFRVARSLHWGK